jgi:flagellar basal-body rod protein FlgC
MSAAAGALDVQRARLEVAISNMANSESTRGPNGTPYRRREVVIEATRTEGDAFGVKVAEIVEDQSPFAERFEPGHPDANESGNVLMPNVHVAEEMVDLMGAARAYQANLAAITMIRETVQKALEIGRG